MSGVDPDARERLAEALAAKLLHAPGNPTMWCLKIADALLPVVQALVTEGVAKELRAAADDQDASTNHLCDSPHWLRDRADALDPS